VARGVDIVGSGPAIMDSTANSGESLPGHTAALRKGTKEYTLSGVTPPTAGGAAANTTVGVGRLGPLDDEPAPDYEVAFMGPVGNDPFAKEVLSGFPQGLNTPGIVRKEAATGQIICTQFEGEGGDRIHGVLEGANGLYNKRDVDNTFDLLFPGSRILHVGAYKGDEQMEAQVHLLRRVREESPNTVTSLSPGGLYARRDTKEVETLLKLSDIVFLNPGELRSIWGPIDYRQIQERFNSSGRGITAVGGDQEARFAIEFGAYLYDLGCKAVFLTLGPGDSLLVPEKNGRQRRTDELGSLIVRTALPQEIVEVLVNPDIIEKPKANGAGDGYAAGVLAYILENVLRPGRKLDDMSYFDYFEAGIWGDIVAHCALEQVGAQAGLPDRQKMRELVAGDRRI